MDDSRELPLYHVTKAGVIENGPRSEDPHSSFMKVTYRDLQIAIDDPHMDLATLAMPRFQRIIEAADIAQICCM